MKNKLPPVHNNCRSKKHFDITRHTNASFRDRHPNKRRRCSLKEASPSGLATPTPQKYILFLWRAQNLERTTGGRTRKFIECLGDLVVRKMEKERAAARGGNNGVGWRTKGDGSLYPEAPVLGVLMGYRTKSFALFSRSRCRGKWKRERDGDGNLGVEGSTKTLHPWIVDLNVGTVLWSPCTRQYKKRKKHRT